MKKLVLIAALLVLALLAGGPLYVGAMTEDAYMEHLDKLPKYQGVEFEHRSYEKGFLGATAELAILYPIPEQAIPPVTIVAMIDVTQHITNPEKFSFAMQNIRSRLGESGSFIVTSWLDDGARESFYEVSRSIEAYRREFPGYSFSEPVPFRDKFIFSVRPAP